MAKDLFSEEPKDLLSSSSGDEEKEKAEAKAKEEAEAKAKKEAEAKAKAEEEAKAKAQAEAKKEAKDKETEDLRALRYKRALDREKHQTESHGAEKVEMTKTAAQNQYGLVEKLTLNLGRIHKRV